MPAQILRPAQARALLTAELAYTAAKRTLERAEQKRAEIRARYATRVPLDERIEVAGVRIKRIEKANGPSFRIGEYLKAHPLTKRMRAFYNPGGSHEEWYVTELPKETT